MPPSRVTLRLAEHVAAFRYQDLPPSLVAHGKLQLLDTLGAEVPGEPYHHALREGARQGDRVEPGRPETEDFVRQRRARPCLRSPSKAAFEVRIFSARCLGV